MKIVDLDKEEPVRSLLKEKDSDKRAIEQTGYDIKYQEELRRHLDRKDALKAGMNQAYALLYSTYSTKP